MKVISKYLVEKFNSIRLSTPKNLSNEDLDKIRTLLKNDYFIICTTRKYLLSSFFISLAHFFLTFRLGHYTHVLMNLEDEVKTDDDFRLIEATTKGGTKFSSFERVFTNVDSVAFLKPKSMTLEKWTKVMDNAKTHLGKPYDTLFDLKTEEKITCVELIRLSLMAEPNYSVDFANFESMIRNKKNLTPQMFYDCPDFEVVYEFKA